MQFRQITIDGDDSDWTGVDSNIFSSRIMRQSGHLVIIDNDTFTPGNISVAEGDSIIWKNQDENTTTSKLHQIALGVEAPETWTSSTLDFGDDDFYIPNQVANYSYHTSKTNFLGHNEGNISVSENEWEQFSYSVAFASSVSWIAIKFVIFNISGNDSSGNLYLRGFDVIMDDFADESIEGENAFRVEMYSLGYRAKDMYYESGFLSTDTSDGETSDILMDYSYIIPETENLTTYLGDLFFEIKIPINSLDIRDIGSSVGQSIGMQVVMRLSDSDQDNNSTYSGVRNFYRGGGYPIITPYSDDVIYKFDLYPSDFVIIDLLGDNLLLIIQTILEEAWIFVVSVIAGAFGFIFGGIVISKRKRDRMEKNCIDGTLFYNKCYN